MDCQQSLEIRKGFPVGEEFVLVFQQSVTIKAARQVGGILKYAMDMPQIEASYSYYM